MTICDPGAIVLVHFPFAELSSTNRPQYAKIRWGANGRLRMARWRPESVVPLQAKKVVYARL
jgi:hypothetical protein